MSFRAFFAKVFITSPEEARHAHMSAYVLYREAISWSYQRKIRADRTLFLCLIQLCSLPQWFSFDIHSLLEEPSCDE